MYREILCSRKIWVKVDNPSNTKTGQSYYSGEGYLKAIHRPTNTVCVYFIGKGCGWFKREQISLTKQEDENEKYGR